MCGCAMLSGVNALSLQCVKWLAGEEGMPDDVECNQCAVLKQRYLALLDELKNAEYRLAGKFGAVAKGKAVDPGEDELGEVSRLRAEAKAAKKVWDECEAYLDR